MALLLRCDACGKTVEVTSQFGRRTFPVEWQAALTPGQRQVEVCGAACAERINDALLAQGIAPLHWVHADNSVTPPWEVSRSQSRRERRAEDSLRRAG